MANAISLGIDITLQDVGTLNDLTSYTSPVRGDVGVFISAFKTNSSSVQTEIDVDPSDTDPAIDNSWQFDVTSDGWYQFYYVAIPNYSGGTTYSQYDAAYDPATKLAYRSIGGANTGNPLTDPTFWEALTDPAELAGNIDLANESLNIDAAVYERILTPKVDRLYGDKAVIVARECCNNCETEEHVDDFEFVFALREGALISEERFEYAEGEKIVRRLDEFIS